MDTPPVQSRFSGRRRLWAAVAGAVVVVLVVLFFVLTGGDDDESDTAGSTSAASSSSSSAPSTGAAPGSTDPAAPTAPATEVDPNAAPPSLAAVPLDAVAAVGNGVTATIAGIEAIQGQATGPGNVAGPALRVTVRITNGSGAAANLDGVAVNMAYGADLTPASPLDDPSQRPFAGSVDPGGSAEGVYVFSVPAGSRDSVTIDVGYQAGAPILVFTGSAG